MFIDDIVAQSNSRLLRISKVPQSSHFHQVLQYRVAICDIPRAHDLFCKLRGQGMIAAVSTDTYCIVTRDIVTFNHDHRVHDFFCY